MSRVYFISTLALALAILINIDSTHAQALAGGCVCQYQEIAECGKITQGEGACNSYITHQTKQEECEWTNGVCTNRFKNDCDMWAKRLPKNYCSVVIIRPINLKIENIPELAGKTYDSFDYEYNGHGKTLPQEEAVINACLSITNSRLHITSNSCSTFQNKKQLKDVVARLQEKVRRKKDLYLTWSANQEVNNSSMLLSKQEITINQKEVSTEYPDCRMVGATSPSFDGNRYCYAEGVGERLFCRTYDDSYNLTIHEKICCPVRGKGFLNKPPIPAAIWFDIKDKPANCGNISLPATS